MSFPKHATVQTQPPSNDIHLCLLEYESEKLTFSAEPAQSTILNTFNFTEPDAFSQIRRFQDTFMKKEKVR